MVALSAPRSAPTLFMVSTCSWTYIYIYITRYLALGSQSAVAPYRADLPFSIPWSGPGRSALLGRGPSAHQGLALAFLDCNLWHLLAPKAGSRLLYITRDRVLGCMSAAPAHTGKGAFVVTEIFVAVLDRRGLGLRYCTHISTMLWYLSV